MAWLVTTSGFKANEQKLVVILYIQSINLIAFFFATKKSINLIDIDLASRYLHDQNNHKL